MTTVTKVIDYAGDCAARKLPVEEGKKVAQKAVNETKSELEKIYTKFDAPTGNKAEYKAADAFRSYNEMEAATRDAVAEANKELAKSKVVDTSIYLG